MTTGTVDWDPFVFLGLEEIQDIDGSPSDMWGDLQIEIEGSGDDIDDEVRAQIQQWVNRSGVYNLVTLGHEATPK